MRVGIGYDIHPLVAGIPCVIGGVEIPYVKGLKGYSDGDVLLHAICDAHLGAVGAGDIGHHFSEGDPRWEGVSSLKLLEIVSKLLSSKGYRTINCDCVVIAEAPRISPYLEEMKKKISRALSMRPEDINVKGTTHDRIGSLGRGEGIVAQAVCLIHSSDIENASDD